MFTLVLVFCLLLLSVLVLAGMRKLAGREEEELLIHAGDPAVVEKKAGVVHRVDAIEKWGKMLTVITVVYGFVVLVCYLWVGWDQSTHMVK